MIGTFLATEQDSADLRELQKLIRFYGTDEESIRSLLSSLLDTTINLIFALLPYLSFDQQNEVLDTIIILLKECTLNCAMCSDVGFMSKLMNMIIERENYQLNPGIQPKIVYLIGILGSHNITARELKELLNLMRRTDNPNRLDQDISPLILETVRKMARGESPSSFFNFDGKDCGLVAENVHFPSSAYTFSCWVRLERTTQNQPSRFFSFLDRYGCGIEMHFRGNHLLLQTTSSSNRTNTRIMEQFFHTNLWYQITITHSKKFILSSDLQLFVNGKFSQQVDLKYPSISNPLNFVHFGTNMPFASTYRTAAAPVAPFCGQCGPIALFDRLLSHQDISCIFRCGPDFQYVFRSGDCNPHHVTWPGAEQLHSRLVLLYNPRACTRHRKCLNNALQRKEKGSDARMLQGTSVLVSRKIRDTLGSIGGVRAIFPLLDMLNDSWTIEYSMTAYILSLLSDMLRHNASNQESMLLTNGFCTLGYLLAEISGDHLDTKALKTLEEMTEIAIHKENGILMDLYKHIFLNFEIWSKASFEVQRDMLIFLEKQINNDTLFFQQFLDVQYIVDVLRRFYFFNKESYSRNKSKYSLLNGSKSRVHNSREIQDTSNATIVLSTPHRFENSTKEENDIRVLRSHLLEIAKLLLDTRRAAEDYVQMVLRYIVDCDDIRQVLEMLAWMILVLDEGDRDLSTAFIDNCTSLLSLLHNDDVYVRLATLKVIGKMVELASENDRKNFASNGILSMIEIGLVNFDDRAYNTLMEIMLGRVQCRISRTMNIHLHGTPIVNFEVVVPFLKVLANQNASRCLQCLRDFNTLLKNNADNRAGVARQSGWQNLILQLLVVKDSNLAHMSSVEGDSSSESAPELTSPLSSSETPAESNLAGSFINASISDLVIETIVLILADFLLKKDGYKQIRTTLHNIGMLSERPEVHYGEFIIRFWNQLLQVVLSNMARIDFVKENLFWGNFFQVCRMVELFVLKNVHDGINTETEGIHRKPEEYVEHDEVLNIAKQLLAGCDDMIRKSLKMDTVMELLHYGGWRSNRAKFGLDTIAKTLIQVATDLTSISKMNTPAPSIFTTLFRLELFLLRHMSDPEIVDSKHLIRLLALLCDSIDDQRIPKPMWRGELFDPETKNLRIFYSIAHVFNEIEAGQHNVVPVAQALLRKNRKLLTINLQSAEAKEFCLKEMPFIESKADVEQFMEAFYSEDFIALKRSEPLYSIIKSTAAEEDNLRRRSQASEEKRRLAIVQSIENDIAQNEQFVNRLVNESSAITQRYRFVELQRLNNWRHFASRIKLITLNEWRKVREQLFAPGTGIWSQAGPETVEQFERGFLILDPTENSQRMRLRMLPNPNGSSHDEASILKKMGPPSQEKELPEPESIDEMSDMMSSFIIVPKQDESQEQSDLESSEDGKEGINTDDDYSDNESITNSSNLEEEEWETIPTKRKIEMEQRKYQTRNEEERTMLVVPCDLISMLDVVKGAMEITNSHLYFLVDRDLNENDDDDIEKHNHKWPLSQIQYVYKRRYMLKHTALEFFFASKTNYFFHFEKKGLENVLNTISSLKPINMKVQHFNMSPTAQLKRSHLTNRWQRREISNFEYLMELNTLANRTYNDLTQYPVFPWVLCDYESEHIDLSDSKYYRDLTKPIGALNEARLADIVERYEAFVDPNIPKFHYGSHYSSIGTVLYYLIRMEPFTKHNITMQGGQFDLPDRLFHSIQSAWNNVMQSNSDVKELIPEFFYCPEFLTNHNRLPLGEKQNQDVVNDVILPPWAKSPEDFIRINRDALESDYVSANLHNWIDLIFGYKQRGPEAEKAYNVFYYLTYEGSVDIDSIDDPLIKRSIEVQINSFGQTPSQLFFRPHPRRKVRMPAVRPYYWKSPITQPFFITQVANSGVPLVYVRSIGTDRVMVINADRELHAFQWMKPKESMVMSLPIGSPMATDVHISHSTFAITDDGRWTFSCGHFDKSIKCSAIHDKLQVKQSLFHHKDVVTCLALSEDGSNLVSGSKDCTVAVWKVNAKSSSEPLTNQPKCTLYGHEQVVLCVDICTDLDMVVSGAWGGKCIIHTLNDGRYIRTIAHPTGAPISLLKIVPTGFILMASQRDCMLYLWDINGKFLCTVDTMDHIKTLVVTNDSKFVICSGSAKQVTVRRIYNLQLAMAYDVLESNARSLYLRDSQHLLSCCSDGRMVFYAIDTTVL